MGRIVGIGWQDIRRIIRDNLFYVDKTHFIKEWWESGDDVTLIMPPHCFGKTLTMSMVEHFFSVKFADQKDLFQELSIWQDEMYRTLQWTYPVISISFAGITESTFSGAKNAICLIIKKIYNKYDFLLQTDLLNADEKKAYQEISAKMEDCIAVDSIRALSDYLMRYYGKKAIILLDEYDTPMQEAYIHGYWNELVSFIRNLFNATFKTNPHLERAIMIGITRGSKESIFSGLNNLTVVTSISNTYSDVFGFTEGETFAALDECGMVALADRYHIQPGKWLWQIRCHAGAMQ